MSVPSYESQREAAASIHARRELGLEYEEQIAAGLAERVEQAIWQQRQDADHQTRLELAKLRDQRLERGQRLALTIVSLGVGIPITAIAGHDAGLLGVGVSWAGIVGVNAIFSLGRRIRRH
ncbi:MAG: hypothetical protein J2P23_12575 [Microlunatus sp.]|nr:hypothetical protein [Microlunatus sp.]